MTRRLVLALLASALTPATGAAAADRTGSPDVEMEPMRAIGETIDAVTPATGPVLDPHEGLDAGALVTDRPSANISSATVGRLRLQLETGVDLTLDRKDALGRQRLRFPTLLRVGIIDEIELRVASDVVTMAVKGKGRLTDMAPGFKLSLGTSERFRLAMLASVRVPTGDERVTRDEVIPQARLLGDFALPLGMSLGLNLGMELSDASHGDTVIYTGVLSRSLTLGATSLGLFVGTAGFVPFDGSDGRYTTEAGALWLVLQGLQLDLYYRFALNSEPENTVLGIGFALQP